MVKNSVQILINGFIESLAVEKGYSENTCRGYRNDLEGFLLYLARNRFAGSPRAQIIDHLEIDSVDPITIRGYLGW